MKHKPPSTASGAAPFERLFKAQTAASRAHLRDKPSSQQGLAGSGSQKRVGFSFSSEQVEDPRKVTLPLALPEVGGQGAGGTSSTCTLYEVLVFVEDMVVQELFDKSCVTTVRGGMRCNSPFSRASSEQSVGALDFDRESGGLNSPAGQAGAGEGFVSNFRHTVSPVPLEPGVSEGEPGMRIRSSSTRSSAFPILLTPMPRIRFGVVSPSPFSPPAWSACAARTPDAGAGGDSSIAPPHSAMSPSSPAVGASRDKRSSPSRKRATIINDRLKASSPANSHDAARRNRGASCAPTSPLRCLGGAGVARPRSSEDILLSRLKEATAKRTIMRTGSDNGDDVAEEERPKPVLPSPKLVGNLFGLSSKVRTDLWDSSVEDVLLASVKIMMTSSHHDLHGRQQHVCIYKLIVLLSHPPGTFNPYELCPSYPGILMARRASGSEQRVLSC